MKLGVCQNYDCRHVRCRLLCSQAPTAARPTYQLQQLGSTQVHLPALGATGHSLLTGDFLQHSLLLLWSQETIKSMLQFSDS